MNIYSNNKLKLQLRLLFSVVLFEYALFIFSGVSFSFLHGDPFFNIEIDPAFWIVYGLRLPQFIVSHYWLGFMLDVSVLALLIALIYKPFNNRLALLLLLLLLIFYLTLMGYLTHRNYQFGFFMVFIPFIFKKTANRNFAYEATRYFLLIFYTSSAFLKLLNNSLSDVSHLSHAVSTQFTPYFVEGNTGIRTNINLYLINHPAAAYPLYLVSFVAELIPIAGFFTRRFDKWIALLLLVFHFMNWLIMDIAPFGQIAFICLLFISRSFKIIGDEK